MAIYALTEPSPSQVTDSQQSEQSVGETDNPEDVEQPEPPPQPTAAPAMAAPAMAMGGIAGLGISAATGPLSQAEKLQIGRLQSGLSSADQQAMSGEITPELQQNLRQRIQRQLAPLMQRQQQSEQAAQQKATQQAMQAAALQAGIHNVNLGVMASALPRMIQSFSDPVTGETEHFYPESTSQDGKVTWKPVGFEREKARQEAQQQAPEYFPLTGGAEMGQTQEPQGPQETGIGLPAGTQQDQDGFHQRFRNGDQIADYIDGKLMAVNGNPVGQGNNGMFDGNGVVTAQGMGEFMRRAASQIPQPKGPFASPRMAAQAQQMYQQHVFTAAHQMARQAEQNLARQQTRTAISADQQKRLDEKEKLQHERLQAQQERADKIKQQRVDRNQKMYMDMLAHYGKQWDADEKDKKGHTDYERGETKESWLHRRAVNHVRMYQRDLGPDEEGTSTGEQQPASQPTTQQAAAPRTTAAGQKAADDLAAQFPDIGKTSTPPAGGLQPLSKDVIQRIIRANSGSGKQKIAPDPSIDYGAGWPKVPNQ